jgi:hypothetical protein
MQTVNGIENSEVTWLVYPFRKNHESLEIGSPRIVFTLWDEVLSALREGEAPRQNEMLAELEENLDRGYVVTTP